ncbi:MAG: serine protease, partial [Cryomorphaceae bacterium]
MRIIFTLLLSFVFTIGVNAQISHGGEPIGWDNPTASDVEFLSLPTPDIKAHEREDETLDQHPDIPYRYGAIAEVDFDSDRHGSWTSLPNGDRVWRLAISSPGALSLNFLFDDYQVPEGGKVFVYNPEKTQLLGSFTSENTSKINSLGVGILHGDKMIIEYVEPVEVSGQGYLHISKITHGYRSILGASQQEKAGPFGNAAACNINVNCPEGAPFEFEKRSVAIIVVNDNGVCSGALVNNTLQDQTPYFLTANHCLPGNPSNTQNWIFYFNHETPDCAGEVDAPTNQSISGASLRASNAESDFGLVEFNDNVPNSYNVCYSGWDASDDETANSSFGIHHPRGDVKKICFDEDAPYHDNIGTFVNQVWYIDQWEDGVTEGGSSGSPLFNDAGLLIGQLAGGAAACDGEVNNGLFDYYGRLGVSWDYGSSATSRLSDWLDEANTGQLILPNSCNTNNPDNDITLGNIENIESIYCSLEEVTPSIDVTNTGGNSVTSFELSLTYNGQAQEAITWTGNLESFQNLTLSLESFQLVGGINSIEVEVESVNSTTDSNAPGNIKSTEVDATAYPAYVTLVLNFDDYPEETS